MKSKFLSPEFWVSLSLGILAVLALIGLVPDGDKTVLAEDAKQLIMGLFMALAAGWRIYSYVKKKLAEHDEEFPRLFMNEAVPPMEKSPNPGAGSRGPLLPLLLAAAALACLTSHASAQSQPTCFGGGSSRTDALLQQILVTQQQIATTQQMILDLLRQQQPQLRSQPIVIEYRGLPGDTPIRVLPPENPNRELPPDVPKRELPQEPPKKMLPPDPPSKELPTGYQRFTSVRTHGDNEWRARK